MTYKRTWDDTLRKIDNGTYTRHIFKANLHEREREFAKGDSAQNASNPAPEPRSNLHTGRGQPRAKTTTTWCTQSGIKLAQ